MIYVSPEFPLFKPKIIKDELRDFLSIQPINFKMLEFILWLLIHGCYGNNNSDFDEINEKLSKIIMCDKLATNLKIT